MVKEVSVNVGDTELISRILRQFWDPFVGYRWGGAPVRFKSPLSDLRVDQRYRQGRSWLVTGVRDKSHAQR